MAERFDVPARLAEGREAVAHTQTYVSACQRLGYSHPELTGHGTQVFDWYDGDDGLDLHRLDDDRTALRAVADTVEEALRVQRSQLGEVAAAWRGPGAAAAADFVRRHCDAGAALAAGLGAAAQACGTLRDELWRAVDGKVTAAVAVDDYSAGRRPVWLAAAHTAVAGSREADDLVEREIEPYVDNDIRTEWLTAMRSARNSAATAYDAATAAVTPPPGLVFAIPGELGPRYQPDEPAPLPAVAPAAALAPAAAAVPVDSPPARPQPAVAPPDDPSATPPDDPSATLADDTGWPDQAGLPGDFGLPGGAGLPGSGSLGGLIPRIVDAIGGLLGSPGDGLADPFDDPFDDEPEEPEPDETDEPDDGAADDEPDEPGEPETLADESEPQPAEPTEDPAAPPADPQPDTPAQPVDAPEKTPCEIAADELPQVGQ